MEKTRENLASFLGELPPLGGTIQAECIAEEDRGEYAVERLILDCVGYERIPAIFVRPRGNGPFPVMVFSHSNGNIYHIGKSELLDGCEYMQQPGYAGALARMGVASIAIDHNCFEERRGQTETDAFKTMLWQGKIMLGYMVNDTRLAVDYLFSRRDVDTARIGAIGMSMGSIVSQWLAALDERIALCVDICCMTNYQEFLRAGNQDGHGCYFYVPGLYNHFELADINALIAPRPHLALAGQYDPLTPLEGLKHDDAALKKVYAGKNAADNWLMKTYPVAHYETYEMRLEALAFVKKHFSIVK
ncbi:MAG: alpha/beta hydrolase [Planctomycetes bacterium]|nr:alpha/beta hydrolase [Planctomycetota bacterium]